MLQETEHRGIHPEASYSLLRFSGFFCWIPRGKRSFLNITLETSVLQKANLVRRQHNIQAGKHPHHSLRRQWWQQSHRHCVSLLVLHGSAFIAAASGAPEHTCFCSRKWDLALRSRHVGASMVNCKGTVRCQLTSHIRDSKHHRIGGGLMAVGTEGGSWRRVRVIAGNKSDLTSYAQSYVVYSIYIKKILWHRNQS